METSFMHRFKLRGRLLGIVLATSICFVSLSALAQFTSGVQGTVTDATGALVPGARVTLTNTATGVVLHATSNDAGVYRFLSLAPGEYSVVVDQSGFKEAQISTHVATEETAGVNVVLQVAAVGEKVTVTAQAPGLNPDETRLQLTLEASQLSTMPTQNHSTLNFVKLAPGTTGISENQQDSSSNRNYVEADANGRSGASNLYTLDGVPINSVLNYATAYEGSVNGAVIFTPNVDSLAEVALQTATFNVDYGNAASMQVGFSTKSGANKFHGVADFTYSDKIMNAVPFGASPSQANHDVWDSFALGGPIWKDHTFFFGAYEHTGNYGGASSISSWWTPAFQTFIGQADPNSINVKQFMLANPASRLVSTGAGVQTGQDVFGVACGTSAAFNVPCSMAVTEQGTVNAPNILNGENWNVRLDQYLNNNRDRIFVYYFSMDQNSNSVSPNPTWDGETPTDGKDLTANYTHSFTSNLLNSATFAYTKFDFTFSDTPHSTNLLEDPFITDINDAGSINGFTRFVPFGNTERQFYGRDYLLWTRGRHSYTFGFEAANNYQTNVNYVYARPFINTFNSTMDFLNDQLDSELVLAHYSALTGDYLENNSNGIITRYGLYAEDSWKVTPRLLINYGIRWDDLGNPAPYTGSLPWTNSIFSSGLSLTQIAQTAVARSVNHALAGSKNANFLPRAGFSWTPFKNNPSTVIRGGAGLYQDLLNLENITSQMTSDPPDGALTYSFTRGGTGIQPILSYGTQANTPPYGIVFPTVPTGSFNSDGSPVGSQTELTGVDPNLAIPKTVIWNLAVEQQMPASAVFSLTYSGSHSYNQTYQADLNRPAGNYYCDTPGPGCAPTNHLVNNHWDQINPYMSGEIANYDAMIAQLSQNWHSLSWQASYTWSHSLDEPNGGPAAGGQAIELQYNPAAQYSNSDSDIRNRFTVSYTYQIPVSHNFNPVIREVAGGWNLAGDVIAQGGLPFTVYYSTQDFSNTGLSGGSGSFYSIPDYTGKQRSGWSKAQEKNGIFGPTALDANGLNPLFPAPSCTDCIGNAGRNQFRNNGYATWDQSIVKKIKMPWFQGENSFLSLRGQAFNLLNRVNFDAIQGNNQIASGSFGFSPGAYQARTIQIGARFEF